jgi:hypothetical protein
MPLTPYGSDGGSDWLQSLLASFGAGQPYGPSGYPDNLPNRPYGPPGGGAMNVPGATAGGPSMGYPAMGPPGAQPPPAAAPSPPFFQFGGFHPENIFQHHPPGSPTLGPVFGGGAQAAPAPASLAAASLGPLGDSVNPHGDAPPDVLSPEDIYNRLQHQPPAPAPPPAPAGQSPYDPLSSVRVNPIYAPAIPPSRPAASPPGNPSATPRPATPYPPRRPKPLGAPPTTPNASPSNPRFGLYQPQVPGSGQGGPLSRSPIYTTLNLFGAK